MTFSGRLSRMAFGISSREATFARRGFPPADPTAQAHLEHAAQTFVLGYNTALSRSRIEPLAARLREVEPEFRGFAFEGAAMGLALLDHITPWRRNRWCEFLEGPGEPHAYMLCVGAGWAAARLPWARRNLVRYTAGLDPLLRWLVVDGYGFHEGFFCWRKSIQRQLVPSHLTGYARRVFDQGLGRSLWFVNGADVNRIASTIETFPSQRRSDLYAGIGLACAYAGRTDGESLQRLKTASGDYRPNLAQGVAFAAKARLRAGKLMPHTELASQALCEMSAEAAASITDQCLDGLPGDGDQPAFEHWRRRIEAKMPGGTGRPDDG